MRFRSACVACALFLAAPAAGQELRPLTALDLYQLKTAGNVTLSPDGRQEAYVVTEVDSAENRYRRELWIAGTDGTAPRRITWSGSRAAFGPVCSPDGRNLAFVTPRQDQ